MPKSYRELGRELGELVEGKASAYGRSVATAADCLALLYPEGVLPERYEEALTAGRIFEKLARRAHGKGTFDESEYLDIAGHALVALGRDRGVP